ncbi:MAG: amidohydrolase family protein [Gammaproteobacteria bacterium]
MLFELRPEWLAKIEEDILEPERVIVDPHHHFFIDSPAFPYYDLDDLWADTATHHIAQTVYLQCGEGYRVDGPDPLKPVGETEWVDGLAARARQRPSAAQIGAIAGTADLRLGAAVREVLEAHCEASTLFRGIRQIAAWDEDESLPRGEGVNDAALYADADFRAGFAVLVDMGLTFDAWHYFHQTPQLTALAQAFPTAAIVLDHFGSPLGTGPYAGKEDEIFTLWQRDLAELARCPNVTLKIGGLAMPWNGFGFEHQASPPSSDEFVRRQRRYFEFAIEQFGPDRCMFESNFPVDKCSLSYAVLWNAFKKLAAGYSETEKDALFCGTASRFYKLAPPA